MPGSRFSARHGHTPSSAAITVREDAPDNLRYAVQVIGYKHGFDAHSLRDLICGVLVVRPDSNNWSTPNVDWEVGDLLRSCVWYRVYDIIEEMYARLKRHDLTNAEPFETEINRFFSENGIGWKLENGAVETRGAEPFEHAIKQSREALAAAGMTTASAEIHEALLDLSRRPKPDLTGSIHHAIAALECAVRELSNDSNATISEAVRRYPGLIPKPLDTAVDKIYGYASEAGRHLREGGEPSREEAELVVGIAAAVSEYLSRKRSNSD